jgi:beta-lactam-binding protein with PASTA domain
MARSGTVRHDGFVAQLRGQLGRLRFTPGLIGRVLVGLIALTCLVYLGWVSVVAVRTTEVPDVVGHASADAGRDVRGARLTYESITIPNSTPRDTIIRTYPSAGTVLPRDSEVLMWVSAGPG